MAKETKFEDLLDEALKTGKGVLDKDPNVKEYPNPTTAKELGIFNSDKEQGVTVSIPQTNAPINVTVNMDMRTQIYNDNHVEKSSENHLSLAAGDSALGLLEHTIGKLFG